MEILSTTKILSGRKQQIVDNLIAATGDGNIVDILHIGVLPISTIRSLQKGFLINIYINIGAKVMKRLYKEWWEIWKSRCDLFIKTEKEWNITREEKWKKERIKGSMQLKITKSVDIKNDILKWIRNGMQF